MLFAVIMSLNLTLATVFLHGAYTLWFVSSLHKQRAKRHEPATIYGYIPVIGQVVIGLLVIHFAEAALWAACYLFGAALPDFETALYFSLTSYATIGYGDILLPKGLRIIGVCEGLVGTFMCGWSVAIIVAVLQAVITHKGAEKPI